MQSIRHAEIPLGAESIDAEAFANCAELRTVSIPDSVTEIGENALSDAVVLCGSESAAWEYARENALQYIIQE